MVGTCPGRVGRNRSWVGGTLVGCPRGWMGWREYRDGLEGSGFAGNKGAGFRRSRSRSTTFRRQSRVTATSRSKPHNHRSRLSPIYAYRRCTMIYKYTRIWIIKSRTQTAVSAPSLDWLDRRAANSLHVKPMTIPSSVTGITRSDL
jgi:hypothetical protein